MKNVKLVLTKSVSIISQIKTKHKQVTITNLVVIKSQNIKIFISLCPL